MSYQDIFDIDATLVANDFLDNYMPKANGDYVKVYLYVIRNKASGINISDIAEKLELTEGDVNRAIKYWKEQGILMDRLESPEFEAGSEAKPKAKPEAKAPSLSREQQERLSGDEDFRQLLMIAQKYMSMIFTPREVNVLGYLYDSLKLPSEVLDYLVDYCVQGGHSDIRYIEKTGLNWASQGIRDLQSAMKQTEAFDKAKEDLKKKNELKSGKNTRKRAGSRGDTDYDALVMEQSFLRRIE